MLNGSSSGGSGRAAARPPRGGRGPRAAAPVDTGLSLEKIRFRYAVLGSNPPWKPLRA
ncbi:hypothetical protein I4988_26255, partial [Pseudomonas aeruginosa]|nr:hypothetical protein [Pseudomonas aeruginosa]